MVTGKCILFSEGIFLLHVKASLNGNIAHSKPTVTYSVLLKPIIFCGADPTCTPVCVGECPSTFKISQQSQ